MSKLSSMAAKYLPIDKGIGVDSMPTPYAPSGPTLEVFPDLKTTFLSLHAS